MRKRIKYLMAGMGSVFSLFPAVPSFAQPSEGTDAERLAHDWTAVGDDFRKVIAEYEQQANAQPPASSEVTAEAR